MRGVLVSLPARFAHAIKKPKGLKWEYQIAAGNAGCPFQFRYRGGRNQSRVPELWTLGHMKLKPHLPIAFGVAYFHFCIGLITSACAAGQADSLGQPHGYGWIIAADIFTFPFGPAYDWLVGHAGIGFTFERLILPAMLFQSLCWGLVLSAFFRNAFHHDKPVA